MMKKLENKVALVTSATRGIGLASALALAEQGAWVFMAVRRLEATEEICNNYREQGYKMTPVYFDATVKESYSTMLSEVMNSSGKIDILINNFGIGKPTVDFDLINSDEEAFWETMHLNLGSVYTISKEVIPHMIKQGGGSIVNISSTGGSIPDLSRIGYGVSKAAINNITQQIALQYARYNIRCNAVLPGLTATDAAINNMPQAFIDSFLSHVPLNRMGKPEDIDNAEIGRAHV